jgi:excisionase family DNA binding protein
MSFAEPEAASEKPANRHDPCATTPNKPDQIISDRPLWCRPREACRLAGVGMTKMYEWIRDGTVASRRVGAVRLISIASLEKLGEDA